MSRAKKQAEPVVTEDEVKAQAPEPQPEPEVETGAQQAAPATEPDAPEPQDVAPEPDAEPDADVQGLPDHLVHRIALSEYAAMRGLNVFQEACLIRATGRHDRPFDEWEMVRQTVLGG